MIKGIYGIEQSCQMIVDRAAPYKCIAVGIGLYLGAVNKQFLQRDQPFLFQPAQELVMKVVQYFGGKFFAFELVKCIPFRLLTFSQPDKSQVSFTQFYNAVNTTDSQKSRYDSYCLS